MFKWLLGALSRRDPAMQAPTNLPQVERDDVRHCMTSPHGLPRIDWGAVNAWLDAKGVAESEITNWRRAVAAAWLDEIRDELRVDHRRWRSANVEGVAPLEGLSGQAIAEAAEKSYREIGRALKPIRGERPIAPIAIIALVPASAYLDFTSAYIHEEGEFATSGGMYLRSPDGIGSLVINAVSKHSLAHVVAHELTHHALDGHGVPLWAEEGLTQMMEERVAGSAHFVLNSEMMARHRNHWNREAIADYLIGTTFLSPDDDRQELSYHLSQWVIRSLLSEDPARFFRFARNCVNQSPDEACSEAYGLDCESLIVRITRLELHGDADW